jgi:hypothetical protein
VVRAKKESTSLSPVLNQEYWTQFGLVESSATREKLLYLAFSEISRRGILDVNARWLCDLLELDPSAVNYHFGSFDALVAEVFVLAHRLWEESIFTGVSQPASSPEERLRNLLNAQLERAVKFGSVIGLAHLPHVSERVTAELDTRHPGELARVITYAVAVTAVLIEDVNVGSISEINLSAEAIPTRFILESKPDPVRKAERVQWSIVGPTMWMTGAGAGANEIAQVPEEYRAEVILPDFVEFLISTVNT